MTPKDWIVIGFGLIWLIWFIYVLVKKEKTNTGLEA